MSRLDSFIRRLEAQRACLNTAVALVADLSGPILELGLGNGRTFDHLREICPDREIFVFERQVAAHPDCVPDSEHLILGDIHQTLPVAVARFRRSIALIHADIGTGDAAHNARVAGFVASHLPNLLISRGIAVSDQDMRFAGGEALPLPAGIKPGRYFVCRAY
jgi:hypothetical protein